MARVNLVTDHISRAALSSCHSALEGLRIRFSFAVREERNSGMHYALYPLIVAALAIGSAVIFA
jgi:hypothetical protein